MDKIDGDSTKSESSGEGSKSSVTSPGGNGPPSKRSRYGDDTSLAGYQNRKIIHYKIGKEFKMNFSIFFCFNWSLLELLVPLEQILRRLFVQATDYMLLFVLEEVNPMTKMNLLKPRRKGREYDVRPTMPGKGTSTSCVFTLTYPFYFIRFEKKFLQLKKIQFRS